MSLSLSCLKRLNLKEPILVVFLSCVGSELQSLAPAIWTVFLPEEVLDCGTLRVPWFPQISVLDLSPTGEVTL